MNDAAKRSELMPRHGVSQQCGLYPKYQAWLAKCGCWMGSSLYLRATASRIYTSHAQVRNYFSTFAAPGCAIVDYGFSLDWFLVLRGSTCRYI